MRHFAIYMTVALVTVMTAGCRPSANDTILDRAESLMFDHPDSALAILRDSIDAATLPCGSERQARYALLMSQALDKNYIDTDNDSLISIATTYYKESDDKRSKMLAYYYLGRVKDNGDSVAAAMLSYLPALDLAQEAHDDYWIGLISREISHLYTLSYDGSGQLRYARLSHEHMRRTGLHSYTCSTLAALIQALLDKTEANESIALGKQLIDSIDKYGAEKYRRTANHLIGKGYLMLKDYKGAIPYLEAVCATKNAPYTDTAYLGVAYNAVGRTDEAKKLLSQIDNINTLEGAWLRYEYYKDRNAKKELEALKILDDHEDKKFSKLFSSDLPSITLDKYNRDKELARLEASEQRMKLWLVITLSIIAITILIILFSRSYRRQRAEIKRNIGIADNLREILSVNNNHTHQEREIIKELLASKYELIDNLCNELYQKKSSNIKRKISDEVSAILLSLSPDGTLGKQLERQANRFYNGIMGNFRRDFPDLRDSDYFLFLLSVWGFSMTAVTLLLNEEKIELVYNRKSRLKARIKRSDSPNADQYLSYL